MTRHEYQVIFTHRKTKEKRSLKCYGDSKLLAVDHAATVLNCQSTMQWSHTATRTGNEEKAK